MIGSRSRENSLALDADRFLALLADSLASILGVGERAKVLVLQLGDFLVFFGKLRAQSVQIAGALAVRRLSAGIGLIEFPVHAWISVLRVLVSLGHFYGTESALNVSMIHARATAGDGGIRWILPRFRPGRAVFCSS